MMRVKKKIRNSRENDFDVRPGGVAAETCHQKFWAVGCSRNKNVFKIEIFTFLCAD